MIKQIRWGTGLPLLANSEPTLNPCKGWFFRGRVNQYYANGQLRDDRRLVLLKRLSCKGCESCEWLNIEFDEGFSNHPLDLNFVETGKLYKVKVTGGGGYLEDDSPEINFIKVDELK